MAAIVAAAPRSGGNSSASSSARSWKIRSGSRRPRNSYTPSSVAVPAEVDAASFETRTCPPWPAWQMRDARWTSMPT